MYCFKFFLHDPIIWVVYGTFEIYTSILFWLYIQFFNCVQDGGPLPISWTTHNKLPALTVSCSASGGGKGPPDLNFKTCRYILDTESALRDTNMDICLEASLLWYGTLFSLMPHTVGKSFVSYELCVCAVLSFATSSGHCLVFLPNMQPPAVPSKFLILCLLLYKLVAHC